ncbi:MAG: hypothetical protein ABSG53_00390 [Thermoguttaceae bacterium]|jgi:hypothetical protein
MQDIYRNCSLILWAGAIVALGCTGLAQRSVQAQNSVAGWPEKEKDGKYTQLKPIVVPFGTLSSVLHNGKFESDEEEQKFAEFFNKSLFPNVTNPANRPISKEDVSRREDVVTKLRSYLKQCENSQDKQVFDKLADLTLAYMTKIAKDGQYHPVARVNAVLAIGEVNSPKAVDALLATLLDSNQFDAVRVAAMCGLVHLAGQSSLSSADVAQPVIVRMAAFIGKPIPKSARADGIRWMHGQAADVLAALKSTGPNHEVPPALLIMLNDKDLPVPLRGKAARALGKLNYGGNLPAAGSYLTALAELLRDALSSDQPANRERVRLIAYDVKEGLQPFTSSSLSNEQALIDGLQKAIEALHKETEKALTSEELKAAIAKAKAAMDSLLTNKE